MSIQARRDVFQAISDPTRREIISLIAHHPKNLNSIAENFDVSRPAISQHIKILMECGLIVIQKRGRERYCKAQLDQLNEVYLWAEQFKTFWTTKLSALKSLVEEDEARND